MKSRVRLRSKRDVIAGLYGASVPSNRSGALFGAFPYPTKISPEAIALFIAAHTEPGDTVFDGFAGSGTTGIAALLCEDPPIELKSRAEKLGLDVRWGPRNAVLYEIGVLGAFVADMLTNPPDPQEFSEAAAEILHTSEMEDGWMYEAKDPDGVSASIRHVIWSDILQCSSCNESTSFWDASVSLKPARFSSDFVCPKCQNSANISKTEHRASKKYDEFINADRNQRDRRPARVYGTTGTTFWSRAPTNEDLELIEQIGHEEIPASVPNVIIPWGDLHRRGYHQGMTHLHHFYTRRNLIVFGRMWQRTERYESRLRDGLRFWLLSYNASHSTIMTRVVAKSNQKDLVLTSAQPGVLYVSSLPVEKNLHKGLRRKLSGITRAFESIHCKQGIVRVCQKSSCKLDEPDSSVDYVFTDPPFGGNIPYSEINFINEAWLGKYTDTSEEATVSGHQGKTLESYEELLARSLKEAHRILVDKGRATVVFHSASSSVWQALQSAFVKGGFSVELSTLLDKSQGSFKQVTTKGAVRGDPVVLLSKDQPPAALRTDSVWDIAEHLHQQSLGVSDPVESTPQRLYSRLIKYYLERHEDVPVDASAFYNWLAERTAAEGYGARD